MRILIDLARTHVIEVAWIVLLVFAALFGPLLVRTPPNLVDMSVRLESVSRSHPFGTDEFGRDIFVRMLYGARSVVFVISLSAFLTCAFGTLMGLISGYFGGLPDLVLSRIMDALQSFPPLLLGIMLAAAFGPSLETATSSVILFGSPILGRVVRGCVLKLRDTEYVQAARAIGASDLHILRRSILPNVMGPIIVQTSQIAPSAVLTVAGLSFLGLGAQPPTSCWGAMIASGREYMYTQSSYLFITAAALSITVIAFNILGDGLRDLISRRGSVQ